MHGIVRAVKADRAHFIAPVVEVIDSVMRGVAQATLNAS
jgi:hypothetical protein